MTWIAQLTYADAVTESIARTTARRRGVTASVFDASTGRLQVTVEVDGATLEEAVAGGLGTAARAVGRLQPVRLLVQSTAAYDADTAHPAPLDVDLVGISEIAAILGVSRQRAGKLADGPDFPAPVAQTSRGRLYTRGSVTAFNEWWQTVRNPRGGRRRRQPTTAAS